MLDYFTDWFSIVLGVDDSFTDERRPSLDVAGTTSRTEACTELKRKKGGNLVVSCHELFFLFYAPLPYLKVVS